MTADNDYDCTKPSIILDDLIDDRNITYKYFELDEAKVPFSNIKGKLCALHINIHSLPAKFDQLLDIISTLSENNIKVHCIMLCETFLNEHNCKSCNKAGYDFLYKNSKIGS